MDALTPAAIYARMSKEDQKYSIDNQVAAINDFALLNGYEIVETFSDPGISGLDLKHRPGLQRLLNTVRTHTCKFQTILVLDVSRWGRFQDIDENAYYEFVCREAGVQVQYCAEMFVNDHSPYSSLIKTIKRIMAAEYSRELGKKVFQGQARLASLGYKQGGSAKIGLSRVLLDHHGNRKQKLAFGDRKNLITDRVILVPGPIKEQQFIRRLFEAVSAGRSVNSICAELRSKRLFGRRWTTGTLYQFLRNEEYVGTYTYNRTTQRLKTACARNPREKWIRTPNVITPIVPLDLWNAVQNRLNSVTWKLSDEELLARLKKLYDEKGYLTARMIDASHEVPSAECYRRRFGSLQNGKQLIGLQVGNTELFTMRRRLRELRMHTWQELKRNVVQNGLRLKAGSYEEYKLSIAGVPTMNFVFAHPIVRKATCREEKLPAWSIQPPRPARIGHCVIGVLSLDRMCIREYLISDVLRKTPVVRFTFGIPRMVDITLAKFLTTDQFAAALTALGWA